MSRRGLTVHKVLCYLGGSTMSAITETKFFELVDFNKTEARVPLRCEYWF